MARKTLIVVWVMLLVALGGCQSPPQPPAGPPAGEKTITIPAPPPVRY